LHFLDLTLIHTHLSYKVVGFVNMELQKLTKYKPDKELKDFLDAGQILFYHENRHYRVGKFIIFTATSVTPPLIIRLSRPSPGLHWVWKPHSRQS